MKGANEKSNARSGTSQDPLFATRSVRSRIMDSQRILRRIHSQHAKIPFPSIRCSYDYH